MIFGPNPSGCFIWAGPFGPMVIRFIDYLITGPGEGAILKLLAEITDHQQEFLSDFDDPDGHPLPTFDLYPSLDYIVY